jgi:hypothetical protein
MIDAETRSREDVKPDNRVDAHTFEVREIVDARWHRACF